MRTYCGRCAPRRSSYALRAGRSRIRTLITTNAVAWETYTLLRVRARNGREIALGFLEDIQDGLCDIERVRPLDEVRAIELLKQFADKRYSFCDALSFVVMEQLGVAEALAFDDDFRSYGKLVLVF